MCTVIFGKKLIKNNFLLHNISCRITPILAVAILIHATLLNHFGNGPVWNKFQNDLVTNCEQYWWSALLYIQNYVNTRNNVTLF